MPGNQQTVHVLDEKTIVWGIHSFNDVTESASFVQDWMDFLNKMFAYCEKEGKTHVIIDVSGNGGGTVSLGLETIRNLFPDAQPYYGFDFRRSPIMDLLLERSGTNRGSHLDLDNTHTLDGKDFSSIQEFLGPVHKYGDYFTVQGRWDVASQVDELGNLPPTETKSPFKIENMVLISDGRCGSTCAIFGEAISNVGVKSIALNGVPDEAEAKKYMQHVGGIKGSQVWAWDALVYHVTTFVPDHDKYDFFPKPMPIMHATSMNLRNSYEPGSDLPLEFTWQPANGHLYLTEAMWDDKTEVWKAAASLAWDKSGKSILKDVPKGTTNKAGIEGSRKKSKPIGGEEIQQIIGGAGESWSYYISWWLDGIKSELPDFKLGE